MQKIKFAQREFMGAFGDLGTLIPIFISLVAINGLNGQVVLLSVGLCYLTCGFYYQVPIPVQPLKAMAAIAIATGLQPSVLSAGGILIGVILLFLATSGLINQLNRIFSRPIIRGIQLGVGLLLIKASLVLIFVGQKGIGSFPEMGGLALSIPNLDDFTSAFFLLVIPQLPLTLGNSIVATCDVARRYFPDKAERVTAYSLSFGLGITNILSGLMSSMPVCHGSGGVTAHYSFGARTGTAPIIMGSLCLVLGLIFAGQAINITKLIPYPILGIMLGYIGLKHIMLVADFRGKELFTASGIGIVSLISGNLAIGYLTGMAVWYFPRVYEGRKLKIMN
ncbi:putative sulfate/molybdate transporter [bacterium]|nr:putative sulfate/molybdate transporter [bacterium]